MSNESVDAAGYNPLAFREQTSGPLAAVRDPSPPAHLMLLLGGSRQREPSMIAHTSLPVSDYSRAKAFYIKALKPLGYRNNLEYGESAGFNDGKNTDFWITREETVVPAHIAFEAKERGQVEAFHAAALAAGAKDNGKPGYREYWPGYYAAFVYDADGHNVEAVWYDYSRTPS